MIVELHRQGAHVSVLCGNRRYGGLTAIEATLLVSYLGSHVYYSKPVLHQPYSHLFSCYFWVHCACSVIVRNNVLINIVRNSVVINVIRNDGVIK